MTPLQLLLFFALVGLVEAAQLGVPPETLTAAAFVGGVVSAAGLVSELLEL